MNTPQSEKNNLVFQCKKIRLECLQRISKIEKEYWDMIDDLNCSIFSKEQIEIITTYKAMLKKASKQIFTELRQKELEIEKLIIELTKIGSM